MSDAVLSDVDRRTIANLSIPRNVENLAHELATDPYSPTRSAEVVNQHLSDLKDRGLVVRLGAHRDAAKLAAKLPKKALDLPDEKAEIYVERMQTPRHAWRLEGDLWMLSTDGLDKLREPTGFERTLTLSEYQNVIDQEWARVLRDVEPLEDGSHPPVAGALLEHEFLDWVGPVAEECERIWGERPVLPLAGGAGAADGYENSLVDAINQKTGLGAVVDPWYMALVIVALTDTDTGTTTGDGTHVPTYTGYARKSVAGSDMNAAASGSATNANAITFAACTGGSSTIVGCANTSASTNGTLRTYTTVSSTTISTTQTPATFAASGGYTQSAD